MEYTFTSDNFEEEVLKSECASISRYVCNMVRTL